MEKIKLRNALKYELYTSIHKSLSEKAFLNLKNKNYLKYWKELVKLI